MGSTRTTTHIAERRTGNNSFTGTAFRLTFTSA